MSANPVHGEMCCLSSTHALGRWSCLGALVLMLQTIGCASFQPPLLADLQPPDGRDRALVLVRVVTEVDGQRIPAFQGTSPEFSGLWLGLGDFSSGGRLRMATQAFFSRETMQEGWAYLLLEPGIYYFAPHGIGPYAIQRFEYPSDYAGSFGYITPVWRLEIPRNVTAVYVGTLFVPGRGSPLIFGGRQLEAFSPERFEVRDESALADDICAKWLQDFGKLSTHLMQPHSSTEPLILETPPGR